MKGDINHMDTKINEAIELLRENDYIVKKFTSRMQKDVDECKASEESGEEKDCMGCSCNMCIIQ